MQRESAAFLWDAQRAADRVAAFVEGVDENTYLGDELRRSAVERQLEIVGEALNRLRRTDEETAALIPEVNRIIGLRNVLVHGYAVVDDRVVWAAASMRIPELRMVLQALLSESSSIEAAE